MLKYMLMTGVGCLLFVVGCYRTGGDDVVASRTEPAQETEPAEGAAAGTLTVTLHIPKMSDRLELL